MTASEAKEIEIIAGCEYPGKAGAVLVPRLVDGNKRTVLYTNSTTNDLHEVSFELFQKLVRLPEEKAPAPKPVEPAQVESGDGLPPLEHTAEGKTWAANEWANRLTTVLSVIVRTGQDPHGFEAEVATDIAEELYHRRGQLKASLQREKGLRELLSRIYMSTASGHDSGYVRMYVELETFKEIEAVFIAAAVTGE